MKYGNRHYDRHSAHSTWKRFISSPITIVVLVIVVATLAKAVFNVGNKVDRIDQKLTSAVNEYAKLEERERVLKDRVDFLSTDEGVEAELRSKYKAVAEGEKIVVILEDTDVASTSIPTTTERTGMWKKLLSLIGL